MDYIRDKISLIPIPSHDTKSYENYKQIWEDLKKKLKDRFPADKENINPLGLKAYGLNCFCEHNYASNHYTGKLIDKLHDFSALEIAMICDGGFNWFGGKATKYDDGSYDVVIYTD